jgi:hypothetical protein
MYKTCENCIWHDTCPDNRLCCFYTPYDMEGTALAEYYDSCEEREVMGRITAEEQGNVEEW